MAQKNLELLREEYLKQIENCLDQVVTLAGACNLSQKELFEMLAFAWEDVK